MLMDPDLEPGEPFWERNSFDDSDRFEESICTWSDQESICNNWRGWKNNNINNTNDNDNSNSGNNRKSRLDGNKINSLKELAAHTIACTTPFGEVEEYYPPVPIDLQIRICFWSFPEDEEDIRLYACLANGNAEEYQRAEILIKQKCVKEMLQIGFHLSASVSQTVTNNADTHKVAITFDRQRITSCSCTCDSQVIWCHHIVAVCLYRIHYPQQVILRAPVSESLLRLDKTQLQKFAQYLINEFPQQILPTAQNLLDDLLSGQESLINTTPEAPDPTAGATVGEFTSWCFDENQLHIDIKKILSKQRTNQPTVFSDVNHLTSTAPPASSEYSQLLRPLRGREPEGLYNFLSIVREMLRKRDHNAIPLLEIITDELLACEQIIVWWFETKVSLFSGLPISNLKGSYSCANQHACSSLCDEVVILWRLAALDPELSVHDKLVLERKLSDWHLKVLDRQTNAVDASRGTEKPKKNPDFFSGFKPCLEACLVDWTKWQDDLYHENRPTKSQEINVISENNKSIPKITKKKPKAKKEHGDVEEQPSTSKLDTDDLSIYYYASKSDNLIKNVGKCPSDAKSGNSKDSIRLNMKKVKDPLEILFSKAEGLYAHGFIKESCLLSVRLAQAILQQTSEEFPTLNLEPHILKPLSHKRSKKSYIENQLSLAASDTLNKVAFLCAVLSEDPLHRNLAFKIGLYGIELDRGPAHTKALEVKLINQEQDLICLLKKIPLTYEELDILRDKSEKLCEGTYKYRCDALKPLILAGYIFDALVLSPYNQSVIREIEDSLSNQNQSQRNLRVTQHARHGSISSGSSLNEYSLSSSIVKACSRVALSVADHRPSDKMLGFNAAVAALGYKMNISEVEHPLLCEGTRRLRGELAIILLVHCKDDKSKLELILDKLLERHSHIENLASNLENIKVEEESGPPTQSIPGSTTESTSQSASHTITQLVSQSTIQSTVSCVEPTEGPDLNENMTTDGSFASSSSYNSVTSGRRRRKSNTANAINQPSEASAHFMFELAKTVFVKAGGNTASADIFHPNIIGIPNFRNIHRCLHMCSLKIALYALGLHNQTSSNWMSRTYSSHVTWIVTQALDIGLEAIRYLCDSWQGYLTPIEAADLGDRAGLQRDTEVQRIAAELALSYLDHSHALTLIEIKKALDRCEEQSPEMFEKACMAIENSTKVGEVSSDILFEVAHKWYSMYEKATNPSTNAKNPLLNNKVAPTVPINEIRDTRAYGSWNQQFNDGKNWQTPSSSHSYTTNHSNAHLHGSHITIANGQECVLYIDTIQPMLCPNQIHNINSIETRPPLSNAPQAIRYCPSVVSQQPFHYYPPVYGVDQKMMQLNHGYCPNVVNPNNHPDAPNVPDHNYVINVFKQYPHQQQQQQQQQQQHQQLQAMYYRMGFQPAALRNPCIQPNNPNYIQNQPNPSLLGSPYNNYIGSNGLDCNTYKQCNNNLQHLPATCSTNLSYPGWDPNQTACDRNVQSQHNQRSIALAQINQQHLNYLQSSFRLGIKAMDLINSGQESRNKYITNEKYKEDIKWLLGVSMLLGSSNIKEFITCAIKSITNPLVLADVVECITRSECNINNNRQVTMELLQACQHAFTPYVQYKMKHFQMTKSSADSENILKRAKPIFEMTVDGMARYNELKKLLERPARKSFRQNGKQKHTSNCDFSLRF